MSRAKNLRELIAKIPMAVAVVPLALGIFFADAIEIPVWLLVSASVISLLGAILLTEWLRNIAIVTTIFTVGALLHSISYRGETPYNEPLEMVVEMEDSSVSHKGYTSTKATIEECVAALLVGGKVVVWGDSLIHFRAGDRLHLTTPIFPFRAERAKYAKQMHHRGFVGSISVNHRATYEYIPAEEVSLHDKAVERLQEAISAGDGRAVVLAMTIGERSELTPELREKYSQSGASHLLAVSGLHIGIAFMLINLLLWPLVLLRYGNVARSIGAVVLIWLYVWLCGMSPSAVRAAIMFSLLQLSLASLREYVGINTLAATAFAMLLFDSHLLFDISFQLSFIAVAAILLWAVPLYHICSTRYKIVNALIGVMLVGIASTLATLPLVSHTFSVVSLVGIVINPAVILLANIVVLAGVLAFAIPSLGVVAEWAAECQNNVVEWAASLPYGHFSATMPEWAMWLSYLVFGVASIIFFSFLTRKRE